MVLEDNFDADEILRDLDDRGYPLEEDEKEGDNDVKEMSFGDNDNEYFKDIDGDLGEDSWD